MLLNILRKVLFPFTNLSQGNFYTTQKFLYQLRFFILPVLLLNWNWTCFASFVNFLNIRLEEYNLFPVIQNQYFFHCDPYPYGSKTIPVLFSSDYKQTISCNRKCPAAQVHVWRRTKASLTSCFLLFYVKLS